MTTDAGAARTRRALLTTGAGAAAAAAGLTLARAIPTSAGAPPQPVLLDATNAAREPTRITNSVDDDDVLLVTSVAGGAAVKGTSSGGVGVSGKSSSSIGVRAESDNATALVAVSAVRAILAGTGEAFPSEAIAGKAIETTTGRVRFGQISGVAVIPANAKSVTVDPRVVIEDDSFVLLTPRVNLYGRSIWYVPSTSSNTFRIHMSLARPKNTRIAWLLLG